MKTQTAILLTALFLMFFGTLNASAAPMPEGLGICKIDRVNGYASNTYTLAMVAGQNATLILQGDGDTDLDVYVYDTFGNLIVFDEGGTDTAALAWTCTLSSTFKIIVKNHGFVYNNFVMTID